MDLRVRMEGLLRELHSLSDSSSHEAQNSYPKTFQHLVTLAASIREEFCFEAPVGSSRNGALEAGDGYGVPLTPGVLGEESTACGTRILPTPVLRFVLACTDTSTLLDILAVDRRFWQYSSYVLREMRTPRATFVGPAMGARSMLLPLMHVPLIRKQVATKASEETPFLCALHKVFNAMALGGRNGEVSVDPLVSFLPSAPHQDAPNFLEKVLDGMSDAGIPAVKELFGGTWECVFRCQRIEWQATRYDSFFDVELGTRLRDGTDSPSIHASIRQFLEPEDVPYDVPGHGRCDVFRERQAKKLPTILVFKLQRGYFTEAWDIEKHTGSFPFPLDLSLDEFCKSEKSPANYRLFATLAHRGSTDKGTFTMYLSPLRSDRWYRFDRHNLAHADKQEAVDQLFGGPNCGDEDSLAVMLFYIKKCEVTRLDCDGAASQLPGSLDIIGSACSS